MKKYNYTQQELAAAKSVLITHPAFGTLAMDIKKVENGVVEGLVWNESDYPYNMPEDYHGEYEYMNFPISCVREII